MVSGGYQKETKSTTTPVFRYLPGQEEYVPTYAKTWQDIFAGKMDSPTARIMQTIMGEAGQREAAQERRRISETRGISAPQRARMVGGVGAGVTQAMARVPQEMWGKAAEWLGQYTLQAPAVGYTSRTRGGGGWNVGICSCENLKELNEGYLVEAIRHFRDAHFAPLSDIDRGYKAMAKWFVPLIRRNKLVKKLGRVFLLIPICRVARWVYKEDNMGFFFVPFMYFWVWLWKFYGRITRQRFSEHTPRLHLVFYPLMTTTFIKRLREVI